MLTFRLTPSRPPFSIFLVFFTLDRQLFSPITFVCKIWCLKLYAQNVKWHTGTYKKNENKRNDIYIKILVCHSYNMWWGQAVQTAFIRFPWHLIMSKSTQSINNDKTIKVRRYNSTQAGNGYMLEWWMNDSQVRLDTWKSAFPIQRCPELSRCLCFIQLD